MRRSRRCGRGPRSGAWLLMLGLIVLGLAACGGGGGGSGSNKSGEADDGEAGNPAPGAALFQVSGTASAASSTAVDGDVNDPLAPRRSNDTLTTAQEIPNPTTVGGYANQPNTGLPGASFIDGDPRDLYRVSLAQGQVVRLFVAGDGVTNDLDLRLLELDGTEIAISDGPSLAETIVVPASGDYLIEVLAFSGASNYLLSVGQTSSAGASAPEPDFVTGELIVRFRDASLQHASASQMAARAQAAGLGYVAGAGRHEKLLACRNLLERDRAFQALGIDHLAPQDPWMQSLDAATQLHRDTRLLAKAMRRQADVLSADLNYIRQPTAIPSDELFPLQWHYPQIRLPQAWDNVAPDSGVIVAVIDTGIVPSHSDLQGQLVGGYDFIQDVTSSLDGDGCDPDPTDPGDGLAPGSSSFHGTHVSGTVAARTSLQGGSGHAGGAGVAWNARVMPLRVLGRGGGTDFDIMQAIQYAAGLNNACGVLPAEPANVLNLSLGGPGSSSAFQALIQQVRSLGITVVAAAGNFSTDALFFPAAYDGVISVSAVDFDKQLAPYSNFGSSIDVAAPGGDLSQDRNGDGFPDGILSTRVDGATSPPTVQYGFAHGTSMAAPHVAGVIALMLGVNPSLNPFDIDALLQAGALSENIGSSFLFGAGLIDAFAAISAAFDAQGGSPPVNQSRLSVSPSALNLGALGTQADLQVTNGGGTEPPLTILAVEALTDDGAAWLAVASESVDASGLGSYRVSVDRSQAGADGVYTGVVRFTSNNGELEVPIIMQVGAVAGDADAGHHFVVLLDPDTLESMQGVSVQVQNGIYTYRFDNVAPGEYLIVAGSDLDNDFVICDPGEACGAYPTGDDPLRVSVDADRLGLDFVTGFSSTLSSASPSLPEVGFRRVPGRRVAGP